MKTPAFILENTLMEGKKMKTPAFILENTLKDGKKMKTQAFVLGLFGFFLFCTFIHGASAETNCERSAKKVFTSSHYEAQSDYWLAIAKSWHLPSSTQRLQATRTANAELREAQELIRDQREARLDLCENLHESFYHPVINPANFVNHIDNPYLPLVPGTIFTYETETDKGTKVIRVEVTDETKVVLGVECIVVRDTVTLEGVTIEDTRDYFAQDVHGNVWYFGEISQNFEEGDLVSLDGSWKGGVDGAKPGIVMQADPASKIGKTYRLEFFAGEAEDTAKILNVGGSATVPYGMFYNLLKTEDYTPISPGAIEHKYYAPGVGFVLEIDPETGERLELVDIQHP